MGSGVRPCGGGPYGHPEPRRVRCTQRPSPCHDGSPMDGFPSAMGHTQGSGSEGKDVLLEEGCGQSKIRLVSQMDLSREACWSTLASAISLSTDVLMGRELADVELDVSFPCFPDVTTIWSSVSKHVRQQLLQIKVGSYPTSPLAQMASGVPAALCQQVLLFFPEQHCDLQICHKCAKDQLLRKLTDIKYIFFKSNIKNIFYMYAIYKYRNKNLVEVCKSVLHQELAGHKAPPLQALTSPHSLFQPTNACPSFIFPASGCQCTRTGDISYSKMALF